MTDRATIIREAFERNGVKGDAAISRETGFNYDRLHKSRMKDIGGLSMREFWLLQRHAYFSDNEVLAIAREEEMSRNGLKMVTLEDNKIEQIKRELESMATFTKNGLEERFSYLSGRYTNEKSVPKELIDFILQIGKEVQLI